MALHGPAQVDGTQGCGGFRYAWRAQAFVFIAVLTSCPRRRETNLVEHPHTAGRAQFMSRLRAMALSTLRRGVIWSVMQRP